MNKSHVIWKHLHLLSYYILTDDKNYGWAAIKHVDYTKYFWSDHFQHKAGFHFIT